MESVIIQLVKPYRHLWDPNDPMYKLKSARKVIFTKISEELNKTFPTNKKMTSVTVQEKWNNLRTYFSRQLKKQRNVCSGMSSDDVFNSKWEHFQSMMFLKETFIPRTSISNLPLEKADQLNSEDVLLRNYIADKENTYNLYDERNFPVYNTETEDEVSVFEINEVPNIDMFSSSTPISNSSDIHTDHNYPKKINFANKSTTENEPYHFPVFQTIQIPTKRNILNNSSSNIDVIRSPSISNSSDIRTDHNSKKSTTQNESYNIPIYQNARKPIKKIF